MISIEPFLYEVYPYAYLIAGLTAMYNTNLLGFFSGYVLGISALAIIIMRIKYRSTPRNGVLF